MGSECIEFLTTLRCSLKKGITDEVELWVREGLLKGTWGFEEWIGVWSVEMGGEEGISGR